MEKVNKKEIRLTYYLENKEDEMIWKELSKSKQPGRVVKEIVAKSFKNNNSTDVNLETLKLLEKLTDKIENLQIGQVQLSTTDSKSEDSSNEIELTAEVNAEDIDDIDF